MKKSNMMTPFAGAHSPEPSKLAFLDPQQFHLLGFTISRGLPS